MPDVPAATMTKEEALLYISRLNENQKVKIHLVSNESKKENKQLLMENQSWDFGCYKD
jgi:hypothetical protein|tara:strand:- start:105 stop:278 length:174 start_codon:yes stop_codon:yes gene_type:complete